VSQSSVHTYEINKKPRMTTKATDGITQHETTRLAYVQYYANSKQKDELSPGNPESVGCDHLGYSTMLAFCTVNLFSFCFFGILSVRGSPSGRLSVPSFHNNKQRRGESFSATSSRKQFRRVRPRPFRPYNDDTLPCFLIQLLKMRIKWPTYCVYLHY
jgi:hypothetical protein